MNYQELKMGSHELPAWDALMPAVLELASTRDEWQGKQLDAAVADYIDLPESLRQITYQNGNSIINDRAGWALSELFIAGVLNRVRRGYYQVSELGKSLVDNSHVLTRDYVRALPKYQEHLQELAERQKRNHELTPVDSENVEVDVQDSAQRISEEAEAYNNEVATTLLQRIREAEPSFFENLVVHLLVAMGYKGPNGSARVTQKTNDGGIDGVINQDALGTSTVYIQAKRYSENNTVQRPAIDSFYGALSRQHADRGVFITTSSFSAAAQETAKGFSIVLIDGIQLTSLMLQYHVGVQVKQHYELFQIDEDFFEN